VVFNDDIGENQESVSRETDLAEVLRFSQGDRNWYEMSVSLFAETQLAASLPNI
jgi:hypothetical protein